LKEMNILCWNVNGIRAAKRSGLLEWLYRESPDILCVQETKANPDQMDDALREPAGIRFTGTTRKERATAVSPLLPEKSHPGLTMISEFQDWTLKAGS
jgi:exonuclease III